MLRFTLGFAGLFLLNSLSAQADPIITDDFEYQRPNANIWFYRDVRYSVDNRISELAYVTNSKRCGQLSSRIRAHGDKYTNKCDTNCQRAEVRDRPRHRPLWGEERWYGFSFKMTGDTHRTDSLRTIINQWKGPENDGPFLSQRYDNGVFHIAVHDADARRTVACSKGNPHAIKELQKILAEIDPTNKDATALVAATKTMAPMAARSPGLYSQLKTPTTVGSLVSDETAALPFNKALSDYALEFNCIQDPEFQYEETNLEWELGPSPVLPDPTNRWVDMQYRIKGGREDNQVGPTNPGEIEIWANDKHVVTVHGNMGYPLAADYNGSMEQYFKHGIYRDWVPNVGNLYLHFDEYKQGTSRSDVRPSCQRRLSRQPGLAQLELSNALDGRTLLPLVAETSTAADETRDFQQDPLRVVTWNVFRGTENDMDWRKGGLIAAGEQINADVIVLQEVTSLEAARQIAGFLGMPDADVVISDWSDDNGEWYQALEVAVISKLPILNAKEFETSALDGRPPQAISSRGAIPTGEDLLQLPEPVNKSPENLGFRGSLRVELAGGIVLYGVHLKSGTPRACRIPEAERPSADIFRQLVINGRISNAEQRENVMAATIALANQDVAADKTAIILGDFNIPFNEPSRTGNDLELGTPECVALTICARQTSPDTCPASEGYDETHWLLQNGHIGGTQYRPLSSGLGRTYIKTEFADSPIDNIYIAGPLAADARAAALIPDPEFEERGRHFGSDHIPVLTEISLHPK